MVHFGEVLHQVRAQVLAQHVVIPRSAGEAHPDRRVAYIFRVRSPHHEQVIETYGAFSLIPHIDVVILFSLLPRFPHSAPAGIVGQ